MEFKRKKKIHSDDFYYDLFHGGYIKPENLLEGEDLKRVQDAIKTINEFNRELEEQGILILA